MRRTNLDKGLQELHTHIIHLGSLIEQTLIKTLKSLDTGDLTTLPDVIENDSRIDIYCADVERHALRLLLLQQPLAGQDMRFLTATLHISSDLGHIGDTLVEIAEAILKIASLSTEGVSGNVISSNQYIIPVDAVDQHGNMTDAFIIRGLLDLGKEMRYLLQQTIQAFTSQDTIIARDIGTEHTLIGVRYISLCSDILNMQAQTSALSTLQYDASIVQRTTYFLLVAHKLEQIANHLNDICKRIIFAIEGEMTLH